MQALVLDTNIVLDLWVFQDPGTEPLSESLKQVAGHWIATEAMREELARVLAYAHIARRLEKNALSAESVLARFDAAVTLVAAAPKAGISCKDPDDQKFIDLAVAHQAQLFSKDKAVLCMKKRLEALGCALNLAIKTQ